MKKYKRLTERNKEFGIITLCPSCSQNTTCKEQGECVACVDEVYNRLAELEDKIENGTLIELPCKVGDTIWWISSNNRDIIEVVVNRIAFAEHDRTILYVEEKGFGEYTIMFVDDIYTTKAEAEAKLKEIQNAKHD